MRPLWRERVVVAIGMMLTAGALVIGQGQTQFDRTGTGSISGMIVTDDPQPRPLRRAIVNIEEASTLIQPRVVTSDEDGGYVFRNLPPGRYRISATRPPFVRGAYGAKRVAGPGAVQTGTMVVVGLGQAVTNINVVLSRGSVITGSVRDIDGQPARSFRVNAYYFVRSAATGERTLMLGSTATTDDRGTYRLFGLRPGSYLVAAAGGTSGADGTLQTDLEVQRAMDLVQRPGVASAAAVVPTNPTAPPPRRPTVGYVPVYFPGVTDATQATAVTIGVGEERSGIDLAMLLVPTARLEVMVSFPDPRNKPRAQLRVTPTGFAVAGQQQSFATYSVNDETPTYIPGLAPGTYTVTAATVGQDPSSSALIAVAEVRVSGVDQALTLPLQPGVSVSGRITFEGSTVKPPADLTRVRVFANAAPTGPVGAPGSSSSGAVSASGEFTIANVRPGRYRLEATLPLPPHESGWYPKSVSIAGQEAYEGWAEVRPGGNVTGAVITMTDRPTEISGTMTDATGAPAPEYFMIAFSADQSHWIPGGRRIQQVRPASDGLFVFRHLPPGEYRLAAVAEIQEGEWSDPEFLKNLVDASIKITLTEGAKVRQDIRIAR